MSEFFTTTAIVATLASGIRLSAPFLIAALGESVGQRAGVLNLGVEGVMLIGAYAAYKTALETGNVLAAVFVAILMGVLMGAIYAFITVVTSFSYMIYPTVQTSSPAKKKIRFFKPRTPGSMMRRGAQKMRQIFSKKSALQLKNCAAV